MLVNSPKYVNKLAYANTMDTLTDFTTNLFIRDMDPYYLSILADLEFTKQAASLESALDKAWELYQRSGVTKTVDDAVDAVKKFRGRQAPRVEELRRTGKKVIDTAQEFANDAQTARKGIQDALPAAKKGIEDVLGMPISEAAAKLRGFVTKAREAAPSAVESASAAPSFLQRNKAVLAAGSGGVAGGAGIAAGVLSHKGKQKDPVFRSPPPLPSYL